MTLKNLLKQNKIRPHKTNKNEISMILRIIERDVQDSLIKGLSDDRRFATAYNAVLQSATIVLHCEGYRTASGVGHHYFTFLSLRHILDKTHKDLLDYFDACRAKRNLTDYISAGQISSKESNELVKEAQNFYDFVLSWLHDKYPKYLDE